MKSGKGTEVLNRAVSMGLLEKDISSRFLKELLAMQVSGRTLGAILPVGDIWQCLKTFLLSQLGSSKCCYWDPVSKARDVAKHPTMHRTGSQSKIPIVPRLRNPELEG